jgi:general stress protein YciG
MRRFAMATTQKNDASDKTNEKNDGTMSVQEAGQKGGKATSETHDRSFYEGIGSEGGKVSPGNFKNDPKRAAEAGSHSHDNDDTKPSDRRDA